MIVVFSVFIANASPASAVDNITFYDYRDFESNYVIDGENDIVYVDLPLTWFYYKVHSEDLSYSKEGFWTMGQSMTFFVPNHHTTYFDFYPFGTPFDLQFAGGSTVHGNFLDLNALPDDSVFYYTIKYHGTWANMFINLNEQTLSSSIYVDDSGNVLSSYDNDVGVSVYTYSESTEISFTNSIKQVGGARGFAFGHRPFNVSFESSQAANASSFTFNISKLQLILSIPSLYRQREQGEVTNGLLKDILNALDASSGGASGDFNNSVGGVTGELGSLGDQLSGVDRPPPDDVNTDISVFVDPSANNQVYGVFSVFWESPMILSFLMITLTFVTCSYVLFGKKG